jgi:4-hydroxyphenylpyruvate dioxygenase-like putative hemolysin
MRLDHIAYRVRSRPEAVKFFCEAFGYRSQDEFEIHLEDGSIAKCSSLEPPEKSKYPQIEVPFVADKELISDPVPEGTPGTMNYYDGKFRVTDHLDYHMAPEIFVSDGPPGSLIDNWVNTWGRGIGGIHHMAYQVESVKAKMDEWKSKGWLFLTKEPLHCEDLVQIFSLPNPITGIIYEFIERKGQRGFCRNNVQALMNATKEL